MLNEKDGKVGSASIRRVIKLGGSLAVTIPPAWARQGGLVAGDDVALVANGELRIVPLHTMTGKPTEVTFVQDGP